MAEEKPWEDEVAVSEAPLDIEAACARVTSREAGGISVFIGTTRDHFQGREVLRLEYESYTPMAVKELKKLCVKIRERWAVTRIVILHRIGVVPVTEASVVVAVSSPHRREAIAAAEYGIDTLKETVPIWKKEIYVEGSTWKENCPGCQRAHDHQQKSSSSSSHPHPHPHPHQQPPTVPSESHSSSPSSPPSQSSPSHPHHHKDSLSPVLAHLYKSGDLEVETPYVRVDYAALSRNLAHHAQQCAALGMRVRPHIKTHKCAAIARLQASLGAAHGITASKVDEALHFLAQGFTDILLAYPMVIPSKVRRLLAAAREVEGARLGFTVDSAHGLAVLRDAAAEARMCVDVYVKVDVGLHRCGIDPTCAMDALLELAAAACAASPTVTLAGLYSHSGQSYACFDTSALRAVALQEKALMHDVRARVLAHVPSASESGLKLVSGCTPTACVLDKETSLAYGPDGAPISVDCTAGNYVFMDYGGIHRGLTSPSGYTVALSVVSTVVSKSDMYIICDAGSKTLSSDSSAHGAPGLSTFGAVYASGADLATAEPVGMLAKLSEEHGWISRKDYPDLCLEIGDRIVIVPNHSCPVANLHDEYYVTNHPTRAPCFWPVDARGCVK